MVVGQSVGNTDVAVIGAGFGGYVAAIRLAELGKKVTIIDQESVGGVCLHHGCIPTKALIHVADTLRDSKASQYMGINTSSVSLDFRKTQEWKNALIGNLDKGIRTLLSYHKIQLIRAHASFEDSGKLSLQAIGDEHLEINGLEFKKCIIACGSKEKMLPNVPVDGKNIMTSTHVIEMDVLPRSVLVIGGGYVGVELSQMLAKLGVKVTVVEFLPRILNIIDQEFIDVLRKEMEALGIVIYEKTKIESCAVRNDGVETVVTQDGIRRAYITDKVIVAVGRVANLDGLQIENTHVKLDAHGFIQVTDRMETHDNRIFAVGDINGGVMLAHKAVYEGKIAAEAICGVETKADALVPYAIFSEPEIAGVGLTEQEAREKGVKYNVKKFPMSALGKAHILNSAKGFFKVLYDDSKHILGFHIMGARASDMIGEAVLAMEMGATLEDISKIIHPHPTLSEGIGEVADSAVGFPTNGL